MLKYLLIAVTALSLTGCVLLIALWVRSHRTLDFLFRVSSSGQRSILGSDNGTVFFFRTPPMPTPRGIGPHGWRHSVGKVNKRAGRERFQWEITGGSTKIKFPHWLIVLVALAVAAIPWIHWSKRFSIRTLLIATTLVAVALGLIVYASR